MQHDFSKNAIRSENHIDLGLHTQLRITYEIIPDNNLEILNIRNWKRYPNKLDFLPTQAGIWISIDSFFNQLFPAVVKVLETYDPNTKEKLHKIIDNGPDIANNAPKDTEITLKFDNE